MVISNSKNTVTDDQLFLEIKNKCAVLGLNVTKESFSANRQQYIEIAQKYDHAAENFLFFNNHIHRQISKDLVTKQHIPEFMAFVKAKQVLMAEFNKQVASHAIQIVDEAQITDLKAAEESILKQQARLREQQQEQERLRLAQEEKEKERIRLAQEARAKEQARLKAEAEEKRRQEQERLRAQAKQKELEKKQEQERLRAQAKQQKELEKKQEQERLRAQAKQQKEERDTQKKAEIELRKREKAEQQKAALERKQEQARLKAEAKQQKAAQKQAQDEQKKADERRERFAQLRQKVAAAQREVERKQAEAARKELEAAQKEADKQRQREESLRQKIEAEREVERKQQEQRKARETRRLQRKQKFDAKWQTLRGDIISVSSAFQTIGQNIARFGRTFADNVKVSIDNTLSYRKKLLEYKKQQYKFKKQQYQMKAKQLKEKGLKTLKVAATFAVPLMASHYLLTKDSSDFVKIQNPKNIVTDIPLRDVTPTSVERGNILMDDVAKNDFLQRQMRKKWFQETLTDRDIDDSFANNDSLGYGVLASSPNMPLFSKCFSECNQRLGEENAYGITQNLITQFKKENPAMANRYSNYLKHDDQLTLERIIAKAQIFDKYDIAAIQNPSIASYMYNLILQQNNDTTVGRVQALAFGIREFYDVSGKELSPSQEKALDNLIDFSSQAVDVSDWRQVIATLNNVIDPNEEKSLFEHIKSSVADAEILAPNFLLSDIKHDLQNEKQFYAFVPTMTTYTNKTSDYFSETSISFYSNFSPRYADLDLYKTLEAPISATTLAEQISAQFEKDMETFNNIHLQLVHDMYIKMQYGRKRQAFQEANETLNKHSQANLADGHFCSGTAFACLYEASDIMKEVRPGNYVSQAVDEIIKNVRNVHYPNTLMEDLKDYTIRTLGKEKAREIYSFNAKNVVSDCFQKLKENSYSFLYYWIDMGFSEKTNARKYHHQNILPGINADVLYVDAGFNNNHWTIHNKRPGYSEPGRYFDVGHMVYIVAQNFMENDLEKQQKKDQVYDIAYDEPVLSSKDVTTLNIIQESKHKSR